MLQPRSKKQVRTYTSFEGSNLLSEHLTVGNRIRPFFSFRGLIKQVLAYLVKLFQALLSASYRVHNIHSIALQRVTTIAKLWSLVTRAIIVSFILLQSQAGEAADEVGKATWYSLESCLREGTSGITASGVKLKDEAFTCASWFYPFGTKLRVTNQINNKSVLVVVNDRGPSKRLVKKGKIIDLSKRAFSVIGDLGQGVVPVRVEKI